MNRKILRTLTVTAAATAIFALAACSGGDSAGGGSETAGATDPAVIEAAQEQLAEDQAGLYSDPPAEGPAGAEGLDIVVIPCGAAAIGCATPARGATAAAEALGWNVTEIDGQLNPTAYQAALRQAIAAQPDGIITVAIDCSAVTGELEAARDAGIPVVANITSFDCDQDGGESLFAGVTYTGQTHAEFAQNQGRMQGTYAIAATEGTAKIINFVHKEFVVAGFLNDGFQEEIATCAGCEILTEVEISGADLGNPSVVAQKLATVLQQYPEATVVRSPSDTALGMWGQTLRQHNDPDLIVLGAEGYPDTLDLMREGYATAFAAYSGEWDGWAAVDTLNRIVQGATSDEIPNSGMNLQLIDLEHGVDPEMGAPYTPSVDYESAYKAAWGVN